MIDAPAQSPPRSDRLALAGAIKRRATDLGFDLVGIAPAHASKYRDFFRRWIDDGRAGTMAYLAKRFEERADPGVYLPDAQSVVCVAINYHAKLEAATDGTSQGRIARYALGDDYHEVLKSRLHALADTIRQLAPDAITKACVDTAPVMEKELAARAGVGWIGKNTCVIHPRIGSWILLGEVITTLELPADDPGIDRCGTCRRCIDACPTAAITAPYQLDATKCISYLTIEHREEIAAELKPKIGDWLYGCDICQEVCPWNHDAPLTIDPAFQPRFKTGSLPLDEVMNWTSEDYSRTLRRSAMRRVKLPVLQRNAKIVAENIQRNP